MAKQKLTEREQLERAMMRLYAGYRKAEPLNGRASSQLDRERRKDFVAVTKSVIEKVTK